MGILALSGVGAPVAAAADTDARLKQAAQHFADLEDAQAKAILDDLSAEGVADADVLLGYLYADPLYEGRDYVAAVTAFKRAADAGNEEGTFQLAESRFWPDYSDLTLTADEEAIRPTAEQAYHLVQPLASRSSSLKGFKAARWRLAHLCTFGGYDCGEPGTAEAIEAGRWIAMDNLRTLTGAFHILHARRSEGAEEAGTMKVFDPYLSLGYADADPFVADAATAFIWRDVVDAKDCPPVDGFVARARFLATRNGVATKFEDRLDLGDCYSAEELETLEDDVVATLDYLGRGYGNDKRGWHLPRCFREQEAPSFGACLIHAVQHHFFSCTKLSLPAYYKRFDIEYRTSRRYDRCREMMLGYPALYNRI